MLEGHDFRGAMILTTVGEDLSGTDQRRFSFSAEANFFTDAATGLL